MGTKAAQSVPASQLHHALVRSDEPGTLFIGGRTLEVGTQVDEQLGAAVYPFVFKSRSGRIAGALPVPAGGFVEVEMQIKQRRVRQVVHQPGGAIGAER